VAVLLAAATLFLTTRDVHKAIAQNRFAGDAVLAMSQLRAMFLEYVTSRAERPKTQWLQRSDSISFLLASDVYDAPRERGVLAEQRARLDGLKRDFDRLVRTHEQPGASADERAMSEELEAQLIAELLGASEQMVSDLSRLARASDARLGQVQRTGALLALCLIAIVGAVVTANAVLTQRSILRPLAQLRQATARVGAGELDFRAGIATANEIGDLSRSFDAMARHLAEREQALRERTVQLETVNKELESFSYSVSHDLRVPLRAVDGFSHMLETRHGERLDGDAKRLIGIVRSNTQKMARLIDDILAFSRMGRKELVREEFDMTALARAAAEELAPMRAGRDLRLRIGELPRAQGDPAMLRQVWTNLIGNAFKFTRPKPCATVEIGSYRDGDEDVYFVKDDGAGFDMEYAHKLFGVFQRLHAVDEFDGTGIGLAIVKRIVTRHGGRVWAEGKVNSGATIYFALPTARAGGARHNSAARTQETEAVT
jgi:signal transduction histidine kinase